MKNSSTNQEHFVLVSLLPPSKKHQQDLITIRECPLSFELPNFGNIASISAWEKCMQRCFGKYFYPLK